MSDSEERMAFVGRLGEEFVERFRRGERPAVAEYADKYPDYAADIRELFPALVMMEDLAPGDGENTDPVAASSPPRAVPDLEQLGDFRIIREVGHGGMGIVYEAEQVSLGRHVALKVLPAQLLHDSRQKRRFEREAKAAARLHHTNIVPVFGVGEHHGRSYYVMQFIQGLGLDEVLEELKRLKSSTSQGTGHSGDLHVTRRTDISAVDIARSLDAGLFTGTAGIDTHVPDEHPGRSNPDATLLVSESAPTSATTSGADPTRNKLGSGRLSDSFSLSDSSVSLPGQGDVQDGRRDRARPTFWHSVAHIGVQVASALQHAHDLGILHRDIKPSNLLLDTRATVWVTDFGLAKVGDLQDLTHTGDILGTLRYMPPEAFDGKTGAQSDVYSLGLTLYELAGLRAAFDENDRQKLIKNVTTASVTPLGRVNHDVPDDLATIIHKAIERDPAHRYASARDFAADLQRFIEDEPIAARRVSTIERIVRWSRRNRMLAASLAGSAVLLVVIALGSTLAAFHFRSQETKQRQLAESNQQLADQNGNLLRERETALRTEADLRQQAENNLYRSLVGEAHALRVAREPGYRSQALERIRQALAIDTAGRDLTALRQEAVACLGDFIGLGPLTFGAFQNSRGLAVLHPNPESVIVVPGDGTLRVFDVSQGQETVRSTGVARDVISLAITPDGSQLLMATLSGRVLVWKIGEMGNWMAVKTFAIGPGGGAPCLLKMLPDGRRFARGVSGTQEITIHEVESGSQIMRLQAESALCPFRSLAVSPDGRRLASLHIDQSIAVWDLEEERLKEQVRPPLKGLQSVEYSSDGRYLVCGSDQGFVIYTTEPLAQWSLVKLDSVVDLAFSPDSQLLASATLTRKVRLWNLTTQTEIATLDHPDRRQGELAFSGDGSRLVSAGSETVRAWNVGALPERQVFAGHPESIPCVAFSPDGRWLASGSKDATVRLWDTTTGTIARSLSLKGPVQSVAFSPDGNLLATGDWSSEKTEGTSNLNLWDAETGRHVAAPPHPLDAVCMVAFSSDGSHLAAVGNGLKVWRVSHPPPGDDSERHVELGPVSEAQGLRSLYMSVSPDSRSVAWINADTDVRLSDIAGNRLVDIGRARALHGWHNLWAHPDGRHLFFVDHEGAVVAWDVISRKRDWRFEGMPRCQSFHCALSPDGRWLAVDGEPTAATICDTTTRRRLFQLRAERAPIWCLAWSPDNRRLALGLSDGGLSIWNLDAVRTELAEIGLDW